MIRRHHLLSILEADEAAALLRLARTRRVAAGQTVFRKDDPGDGLYGVLAGGVAVTVTSEAGKELILNMFGPGEFFGEIALLDGKGRTATAVARAPSELLFIGRTAFLPFLEKHPRIAARMIALLCERLRRTTQLVEDAAFLNVGSRLAKGLAALALQGVRAADGSVALSISQADLARTIGVSREIVSRQLAAWRSAALIQLGRERIVVRDPDAMARAVDGG